MKILITGGSTGLGAEIVSLLAQNNSNLVYFTYATSKEKALQLAAKENINAIHCDFTNENSVDIFCESLAQIQPDILINNAAVGFEKQYFHKIAFHIFLQSFQQNVISTLKITQAFILQARKKKFGKIINIISSATVNKPPIGWSEYVANKAYLLSMNKSWATENIKFNISSNAISPAFMLTNFTASTDERVIEQMIEAHPLKKLLTPKETAETVLFFTTCTQHINGTHLIINAGNDLL